jgi:hypothetical protein
VQQTKCIQRATDNILRRVRHVSRPQQVIVAARCPSERTACTRL